MSKLNESYPNKTLTVEELRSLLNLLRDTDRLYANEVGNLAVFENTRAGFEYIGFIDFLDGNAYIERSTHGDENIL